MMIGWRKGGLVNKEEYLPTINKRVLPPSAYLHPGIRVLVKDDGVSRFIHDMVQGVEMAKTVKNQPVIRVHVREFQS